MIHYTTVLMKKIFLLVIVSIISNFTFSQNHAELENNFNINQSTNINGGMSYGVDKVWGLSNGRLFVSNNLLANNIYNNVAVGKLACLTSTGLLDTSYNIGGSGFTATAINDVVEYPNGKTLVGGNLTSYNGIAINKLIRLNNDGTVDTSFSLGTGFNNTVTKMIVQTDGKIIVAGAFTVYNGFTVSNLVRLNPDGSLDTTFTTGTGFNNTINALKLQSDGKILVGGSFTSYNGIPKSYIARVNSNGVLDTSFVVTTAIINTNVTSILLQQSGKVIIGTSSFVKRVNQDGSADASFATIANGFTKLGIQSDDKLIGLYNGVKSYDSNGSPDLTFTSINNFCNDFIVQNDDKIVVGGFFFNYLGTTVSTLTRLSTNGTVDPTFSICVGFDYRVYKTKVQTDHKILVGGDFYTYNNIAVGNFIRLNEDGTIDSNFALGTGFDMGVFAIDVQTDGKILVGGNFTLFNNTTANYIVRLNSDGTRDTSFQGGSLFNSRVNTIVIQPDGKILVGGSSSQLKRLNTDGSLDTTFTYSQVGLGTEIRAIKLQTDGKIFVAKSYVELGNTTLGTAVGSLCRLNANGTTDTSFTAIFNNGVNDVAIQSDGKIIAVGDFTTVNSVTNKNRIVRLSAEGVIDTTFSTGAGLNSNAYSVLAQPDGEIIVGGAFGLFNNQSSFALVNLNPDGSQNPMFNVGKGFRGSIYCLENQNDGKILVGGGYSNYNTYVAGCLVRLLGGGYYSLSGQNKLDIDGNGCDASDISYPNLKFHFNDGTNSYDFFSNTTGSYSFLLNAGNYTITPIVTPNFTVSPTSITANFPSQFSSLIQNYCLTSVDNLYNDLEVKIIPLTPASPGFSSDYKIIYKNKGLQNLSGNVGLSFDDQVMDYVFSAPAYTTQITNSLFWNFSNLAPQEQRTIFLYFNLNSPTATPPLNSGDVLTFNATISILPTEATPNDNGFTLNQTVVNSLDPNDKTCLEGNTVGIEKIGDYVHYLIRFENNGTANAQFIKVVDRIDTSKFDISTLEPVNSSHNMISKISDGNKVEFYFDNINLPFDDAHNDGYVMYKIKLKPTLALGDSFSNTANIYFDFNSPIITNTATTTISALNTEDFSFANNISIFPNPAQDVLNIMKKNDFTINTITIFNMLGQQLNQISNANNQETINVSQLKTGNYILKITTEKGILAKKFSKL